MILTNDKMAISNKSRFEISYKLLFALITKVRIKEGTKTIGTNTKV